MSTGTDTGHDAAAPAGRGPAGSSGRGSSAPRRKRPAGRGPRGRRTDGFAAQARSSARTGLRWLYRRILTGSMSSASLGIAVCVSVLTFLGCMMVLSASSVEQIRAQASPYSLFARQAVFAVIGLVGMIGFSRIPVRVYKNRRVVFGLMGVSVFLLLLVLTPLGVEVLGNRNWLKIGPVQFQPSELAKFSLAIWVSWALAKNRRVSTSVHQALLPSILGLLGTAGLVLLGGDAGSCIVFVLVYAGGLWFGKAPRKIFTWTAAVGVVGGLLVVFTSAHRIQRVLGWLFPSQCGAADSCYQTNAGLSALATGSWWGVGLGESRQKYSYLPEAHNDFIFAILGEELGFVGAMVVIALFVVLAVCLARIILRSTDRFVRIAAGCVLAWFVGQAFVNIGMVTGLLPVIGIPLPFVSYGGTSLMVSLFTAGFAMSLAKAPTHPAIDLGALEADRPRVD